MLQVNSEIFKAYDIRGIYGQDFDNELAYLLGLAFVELRKSDPDYQSGKKLQIAVGMDMRLSSPALQENLLRGLTSAGADAINIGLVSTPTFYFAVANYNYDGGIMISASHNPKEWNGFKLVRSKGVPISGDTGINFLRDKIIENHFLISETPGNIITNNEVLAAETLVIKNRTDFTKIKKFKIVIDTANGMGVEYIKEIFSLFPCEIIPLNFKLDGSFPAHEADPLKEENLEQLKKQVVAQKADLGISTDGDGDRIFFVDNLGITISPALIRGLLAKIFLRDMPGAKIGYDVRPGKITEDLIKENGGIPVLTKVGHSLIKEQMLRENIYFAGESSGHFYLNAPTGCFEYPSIMILNLLTLFSESQQSVADFIKPYDKYFFSGEINRTVVNAEIVFNKILEKYSNGIITKLDGISVNYPDFWFNVRASNTEPKMRLNLEAINKEIMTEKRDEVLALMN
jgi:phosphomannomutase